MLSEAFEALNIGRIIDRNTDKNTFEGLHKPKALFSANSVR